MNETTQQEKTTQLSNRNEQLNSAAGTKQLNSPVGTKQLNSSIGTKQLNSALPSTACNRLQQPPAPPLQQNRLFLPTSDFKQNRSESRIDAIKHLRYQVGGIYDALLAVCDNSEIDNSIRFEAFGLLSCVKQFKFLCRLVIWYKTVLLKLWGASISKIKDLKNN
ncbi:DUF4371 domain-containing protein [Trichonephila clavipes]|nr:DUF4371 domain-containing protein [Trichonephila clavipes]